jgi:hypothetical protein
LRAAASYQPCLFASWPVTHCYIPVYPSLLTNRVSFFVFFPPYFAARAGHFVDWVPWWSGCRVAWSFTASFKRCSRLFCTVFGGLISDLEVFLFLLHTCTK